MIDVDMIDIDRDRKKITIWDNEQLYRLIESGAVVALFPMHQLLESAQAAAESVDPALVCVTELLTRALSAAYYYHVVQWTIGLGQTIHAPAAGVGIRVGDVSVSTDETSL